MSTFYVLGPDGEIVPVPVPDLMIDSRDVLIRRLAEKVIELETDICYERCFSGPHEPWTHSKNLIEEAEKIVGEL